MVSAKGIEEFPPDGATEVVRIGEFTGPLLFDTTNRVLHLKSDVNARNAIYEQVSGLISQSSPNVELRVSNDGNADFINMLPNIPGAKNIILKGKQVEAERLDELFDKYRHLDSAIIVPEISGIFYVNSQIYNVPNLACTHPARLSVSLLRYFTGENLRLGEGRIDCWEILAFLRKWISGEGYQNLKTLWIDLPQDKFFNSYPVYNRFHFARWGANRPQVYMYDVGVFGSRMVKVPIDLELYHEVVRESDKKLACFSVFANYINFFVWDEEQQG
ncbi:unnamed protein product [Caenorhabditis brenneri]